MKQAKIDQWKPYKPNFNIKMESNPVPCSDKAMACQPPGYFISLLFIDDLFNLICEQSNLYANQRKVTLNLTKDDLLV